MQCIATYSNGKRCVNEAIFGLYCNLHQPSGKPTSMLYSELKSISKMLAGLAAKVEKLNAQLAKAPAAKKAAPAKKKKAAPKKKAVAKKKATAKKAPAKKAAKATVLDSVMAVINKSRSGASIANLKTKTGLESRQLSNALYKLSKKGMIKSKSRGVYIKA